MKIVLLGSTGLLGSSFKSSLASHEVTVVGRDDLALRRYSNVENIITKSRPNLIINCAADTDVEGAEENRERCDEANALLPEMLAWSCRRNDAILLHFSSTGCYGSWKKNDAYIETDPLVPTTTHHSAKLKGEEYIRASGCEHLILRTGWLFGGRPGQRKNFVWNRLVEALSTQQMRSDPFQKGNPTFVDCVVRQAAQLVETNLRGTFNCVNTSAVTRFEYVKEIVKLGNLKTEVVPADQPFRRRASVSPNEGAINFRLDALKVSTMGDWRESLRIYIEGLLATDEWRNAREASAKI